MGTFFPPTLGGALVVTLIVLKRPEIRGGNGIPEVIEAVIFKGGNIPGGEFAVLKTIATAVTIGSGGSVGREGPIGFIGAALTSILARWFNLSREMKRLLVTCGLAAGIAGTFNTPPLAGGAMFALEVVYMGAFSINLVPIFISAVTGNAITLAVLKRAVEIEIPPGGIGHTLPELPPCFSSSDCSSALSPRSTPGSSTARLTGSRRPGYPNTSSPPWGGFWGRPPRHDASSLRYIRDRLRGHEDGLLRETNRGVPRSPRSGQDAGDGPYHRPRPERRHLRPEPLHRNHVRGGGLRGGSRKGPPPPV